MQNSGELIQPHDDARLSTAGAAMTSLLTPHLAFSKQVCQRLVVAGVWFVEVPPLTPAAPAGVLAAAVVVRGPLVEEVADLFPADNSGEAAWQGNHHVVLVYLK